MRTLRIDFTAENVLPDGNLAGRMGEHNATDLIITPPAEMAQCEEIVNYVAAFVTEGKIIRTDFYPKAEQITVSLCSQLTQDHSLSLQLEAYDGTGGLVVKSPIVSELRLLPSAGGDEEDFDSESGGMVSQINLNTLSRHSHSNSSVLEKFGEESGKLTFDGAAVGSGTVKLASSEFLNEDGNTLFWYDESQRFTSGENIYRSMRIIGYFLESVPELPCGTVISKIEVKLKRDSEYVSLDSLCTENAYYPIQKMTNEITFVDNFGNSFFVGFCMFGYDKTAWQNIVDGMEWYSVRITYYAD